MVREMSLEYAMKSARYYDLREYIRKNDYLFQNEEFGQEGDAWRRAVAFFAGEAVEPEAEPVYERRRRALEIFRTERQHKLAAKPDD